MKKLSECRIQRRAMKVTIMLNGPVVECLETEKGESLIAQLQQILGKVRKGGEDYKGTDIHNQGVEFRRILHYTLTMKLQQITSQRVTAGWLLFKSKSFNKECKADGSEKDSLT